MIITIGGEYGSGGKRVAEDTAKLLGYKFCDDAIISAAVADSGVDLAEETFRYFDESKGTASLSEVRHQSTVQGKQYPGLIGSLVHDVLPLDRRMAEAQKAIFEKLADEGNCILMGRCADYYLRDRDDVLSVFISGEYDNRVKRIMAFFNISEAEAKKAIKKTDKRREDFYEYFTGRKWGDRTNYDMMIMCEALGTEGTAQMLKAAVEIAEAQKK